MCAKFMSTNNNLQVKTLIATVDCLRLFVVVYKLVNLVCRFGVTAVVLYMYAVLYAHRNCYSKGIS